MNLFPARLSGFSQPSSVSRSPSVPFGNISLSQSRLLGGASVLFRCVVFVESSRELLELSLDLVSGVFGKESRGSRSPEELLEFVQLVGNELGSLEIPDFVSGFGLMSA